MTGAELLEKIKPAWQAALPNDKGLYGFIERNKTEIIALLDEWLRKKQERRAKRAERQAREAEEQQRAAEEAAREAELRQREAELKAREAEVEAQAAEVRVAEVEVAAQAQAVEAQAAEAGVEVPPPEVVIDPAEQERLDDERYMAQLKAAFARIEAAMDADPNLMLEQAIDKFAFPTELKEALRRRLQSGPWGEHYRNVARACIGEGMPRGGARRFQHPGRERSEACPAPRRSGTRMGRSEALPSAWTPKRMTDWARQLGAKHGRTGARLSHVEMVELGLATLRDEAPFWSQVLADADETGGELQDDVVLAFVDGYQHPHRGRADDETSHYRGY